MANPAIELQPGMKYSGIAKSKLGYAGQPGYLFYPGDKVYITLASNLPQGGFFIGKDDNKAFMMIHCNMSELDEVAQDIRLVGPFTIPNPE